MTTSTNTRKSASLGTIVATARKRHDGQATASGGRWHAYSDDDGDVVVCHYRTAMLVVHADNTVTAISAGWGSMTDKCGVRAIMRGIGSPECYASIYG